MNRSARFIPVSLEIDGDLQTPVRLFRQLGLGRRACLLESVEGGNKWARYSYIGLDPFLTLRGFADRLEVEVAGQTSILAGDPLRLAEEVLNQYQAENDPALPDFQGGAVGYLSYDLGRLEENILFGGDDPLAVPEIYLLVFGQVIVFDHLKQRIRLIGLAEIEGDLAANKRRAARALEDLAGRISSGDAVKKTRCLADCFVGRLQSSETRQSFTEKVRSAQEYIVNGDLLQVVLSQRLSLATNVDPFEVYRCLRSLNPSPYLFYIDFGDLRLAGSSPELLVKVKDQVVETVPIAGTRRRGRDRLEDERLAEELLADPKELAEHSMLVDLGRNDLGKISEFGSVSVADMMHVERFSHVMHIVSNVRGRMRADCSMYDALRACLPAGTVSGAPKVRAMEVISELEPVKRGVYAGAVGYFGFNGNMDMCIAIRTIVFKGGQAHIQAGAGIVFDSVPENEYEETLRKAQALLEAIETTAGQQVG